LQIAFKVSVMWAVLSLAYRLLNRFVVWHRLPFFLSVVNLLAMQHDLRHGNLFAPAGKDPTPPDKRDFDVRGFRTADGSYNDLDVPSMGMQYARFGRNVPLKYTYGEQQPGLLTPNPREISNKLLARKEFVPVPHLNLFLAVWLQFMTHDWFSHGDSDASRQIQIPVPDGDTTWPDDATNKPGHLSVRATATESGPGEPGDGMPQSYRNRETHWWDGSQIYGSSDERMRLVRSDPNGNLLPDGKLYLDERGLLGMDATNKDNVELAGVNGNWWVGLSLVTNLFVREHNAIASHLRIDYPDKPDEWIFQKARLVNAALMTKIHAVEWTPAILNTPALRFGMRGNWWGILGEEYERAYGRGSRSEHITGIPGSAKDHHSAPYSITEEFIAVYRMHSLIPDEFTMRRASDNQVIEVRPLDECAGAKTRSVYDKVSLVDAIYSFGVANCGALTLHNYPNKLRRLRKQGETGHMVDLASVDILRDRERGVPRYCDMRRFLRMNVPRSFEELTCDPVTAKEIAEIYERVEDVDLLVGCLAEPFPRGFGFSDTAFRIFILMATRRIKSDRFYTDDFNEKTYTPEGMKWILDNSFQSVVVRHVPELAPKVKRVKNAFFPWPTD
jgi:hypothetical protein